MSKNKKLFLSRVDMDKNNNRNIYKYYDDKQQNSSIKRDLLG